MEAIVWFFQSPTLKNIKRLFESCGIPLDFDRLGDDSEFRKLIGAKGVRDARALCERRIEEYAKLRNRIVHDGAAGATVSDQKVEEALNLLRGAGLALLRVAEAAATRGW